MKLEGYYINLDRSTQRREHIEQQLQVHGLKGWIERFAAVDGREKFPQLERTQANALGCLQSHRNAIAQSDPAANLLILEDDIEFSADFPTIINAGNIGNYVQSNPDVELIFLDCLSQFHACIELSKAAQTYMPRNPEARHATAQSRRKTPTVSILDAHGRYAVAAAAYIVTPKGKRHLAQAFAELPEIHDVAIDHIFTRMIQSQSLVAKLFLPYLATPIHTFDSTIAEGVDGRWNEPPEIAAAYPALRRLLFAGDCHIEELRTLIAPLLEKFGPTPEHLLVMEIDAALQNWRQRRSSSTPP